MLSNLSRRLTYVLAVLYAILGALLFFLPLYFIGYLAAGIPLLFVFRKLGTGIPD